MQNTHSQLTEQHQQRSPLLCLPTELRNKIYKFAFDSAFVGQVSPMSDLGFIAQDGVGLLLACHQTRDEAYHFNKSYTSLDIRLVVPYNSLQRAIGSERLQKLLFLDLAVELTYHICNQAAGHTWLNGWDQLEEVARDYKSLQAVEASCCWPIHPMYRKEDIVRGMRTMFGKPDLVVHVRYFKCVFCESSFATDVHFHFTSPKFASYYSQMPLKLFSLQVGAYLTTSCALGTLCAIMASANRFAVFELDILTFENQTDSPLLRLPTELRHTIYAFAFDSATARANPSAHDQPVSLSKVVNDTAALLVACRQTLHEAKKYKKTSIVILVPFDLEADNPLADLQAKIGLRNRKRVREVQMSRKTLERGHKCIEKVGNIWHHKNTADEFPALTQVTECDVLDTAPSKKSGWRRRKRTGVSCHKR
ncbi:hypothetical protein OPT61_g3266 [Boeremia exigua]|uniref:Uncharacterized protein n=1 Tax=Boeremia exigua TaxID=749465 RepID=A0ACC2IIN9_9PLEO|nr:hypothetical protein OPT61_g3266 [Boeremia exigua]